MSDMSLYNCRHVTSMLLDIIVPHVMIYLYCHDDDLLLCLSCCLPQFSTSATVSGSCLLRVSGNRRDNSPARMEKAPNMTVGIPADMAPKINGV